MIKNLFAITFLSLSLSFISNISFAQNIQQQSTEIQQLINNKKYDEANQKLNYLLSKPENSRNAKLLFLQGLLFTELNEIDAAIKVFTEITHFYPELPEPYNNLAVLYAKQNQLERAKIALEMAIQTHPNYATAYENLGDIYIQLANQAYNQSLLLKNNSSKSLQNKLLLIKDLKDLKDLSKNN